MLRHIVACGLALQAVLVLAAANAEMRNPDGSIITADNPAVVTAPAADMDMPAAADSSNIDTATMDMDMDMDAAAEDHSDHDHTEAVTAPAAAAAAAPAMDHSEMDHSTMDMDMDMAAPALPALSDPCISDPTAAECATYEYPIEYVHSGHSSVCAMMPFMTGCALHEACEAGSLGDDNPYCDPFTLLATMCQDEGMSGMAGCSDYVQLCLTPGTVVQQCTDSPAVPSMLQTTASQAAIVQACSTHSMPGCAECPATGSDCPNPLATTQRLCLEMTGMEMCDRFETMCNDTGSGLDFFCTREQGSYDPPMRMYFHTGIRDMILFRGWVPGNTGELIASVIAVLLLGLLTAALRAYRACTEAFHRARQNRHIRHDPREVSQQSVWALSPMQVPHHVQRSVLSFFTILFDYSLMLIAMTFNVALFFAVVTGLALGTLLFGHLPERYSQRLQARALMSADLTCGCGTMVKNSGAKHIDDERADSMESGEMARDDRSAPSPPGVCCSMKPALAAEEDGEDAVEEDVMLPQCCKT